MISPVRSLIACTAVLTAAAPDALAQCCPQPTAMPQTVAYAPVAPVAYQTTVQREGWYPGKYLAQFSRNVFSPLTSTSYTTSYAPTYNATPYTAGYAPTYTPTATFQTAYRPTYPITYGPVVGGPIVQGVARPVTLSPVIASSCNACCATGCDACSGVSQAVYAAPLSSGCSSCGETTTYDSQPVYTSPSAPLSPTPADPQPALGPQDNPPAERSFKPELSDPNSGISTEADEASSESGAYWQAPPLFDPRDRVTQKSPAPVWQAVYRRPAEQQVTTARATSATSRGAHQVGASGWTSAR